MSTFKAIIQILQALIELGRYMSGSISAAMFNHRLDKINDAVKKAQSSNTDEAMEGASDVEDNFNRHT